MDEPNNPSSAISAIELLREVMLLEAVLDDGQHFLVDEAADGVLHHAFVLGEEAADVVEIEWIQHRAMIREKGTFLISRNRGHACYSAPASVFRWR